MFLVFFWENLINLFEFCLLYAFLNDKLESDNYIPLLSKFLFIIILLSANNPHKISSSPNFYCFGLELLLYILFSITFYLNKIKLSVIYGMIFVLSCVFIDYFTVLIPILLFNLHTNHAETTIPLRFLLTLLHVYSHGAFVFISHFAQKHHAILPLKQRILFIITCSFVILFSEILTSLTLFSAANFHNTCFTAYLFCLTAIYMIFFISLLSFIYVLSWTGIQNKELIKKQENYELNQKELNYLLSSTKKLRKIKHDLSMHINTLNQLLKQEEYREATTYINKYFNVIAETPYFPSTGNVAIDCILSTRIHIAQKANIDVQTSIFVPQNFPLDSLSTCTLLGNLWDNAIEACKNLAPSTEKDLFIHFSVKTIKNMVLIRISNPFNGIVKKDIHGNYASPKNHYIFPGLGLDSEREIVSKDDGIMNINDDNNIFSVSILIPIKEHSNDIRYNRG